MAALVLAICIRERMPSCIRAPPLAEKMMRGSLCFWAYSTARVIFSPRPPHAAHEEAAVQHGEHRLIAVQLSGGGHRRVGQGGLLPLGGQLPLIPRELQGVGGGDLRPQLPEGKGVQDQGQPQIGPDGQVIAAVGADIFGFDQVLVGALRAAAGAGLGAALGHRRAAGGLLDGLLPLAAQTVQPVPAGAKQWLHISPPCPSSKARPYGRAKIRCRTGP